MDSILEINEDDSEKEEIYKDWERTPIKLFINSYGGSVYDGLALIDVIKNRKNPGLHYTQSRVVYTCQRSNFIKTC
jgi:ATP-dependent Clp protease protease subunit